MFLLSMFSHLFVIINHLYPNVFDRTTCAKRLFEKTKPSLVNKNGWYAIDYNQGTSLKRIETLRDNMVSNTSMWIIRYGRFTIR